MDQIDEMCVCVCVCVENEDEMVGVQDDSELNHSIYRRINSVYFILVPTTNSRMHNSIVLAFGGSFVGSAAVDCGKVMWAQMKPKPPARSENDWQIPPKMWYSVWMAAVV